MILFHHIPRSLVLFILTSCHCRDISQIHLEDGDISFFNHTEQILTITDMIPTEVHSDNYETEVNGTGNKEILIMSYNDHSTRSLILSNLTKYNISKEMCQGNPSNIRLRLFVLTILILIVIGTAGGNFLVILAVILVRKLQSPSNILIVSLAFSDLLVAILVLPLTSVITYEGYWPFNKQLCDMYILTDMFLCTASILNLCAISIDRYLVITRPLTYINRRTPVLMACMIAATWIISALISIPAKFYSQSDGCSCEYTDNVAYQIYATVGAFFLPLLVMLVLYGRIFKLARQMSRLEQRQLIPSNPNLNRNNRLDPVSEVFNSNESISSKQIIDEQPLNEDYAKNLKNMTGHEIGMTLKNGQHLTKKCMGDKERSSHDVIVSGRSSAHLDPTMPRKSPANSDTKVVKTLGVIMGCFCICWLPFFSYQLLASMLRGFECCNKWKSEHTLPVLQWLGYVNSLLNPVIYAKYNREFRLPFKLILLCQCRGINARLRSVAFSAQYGLPSSSSRRLSGVSTTSHSSRVNRRSRHDSNLLRNLTTQPNRPRPPSQLLVKRSSTNTTGSVLPQ